MFEFSKIFIDSRAAQGQHAGNIIGCIFSAKCAFQVQALHQLFFLLSRERAERGIFPPYPFMKKGIDIFLPVIPKKLFWLWLKARD